MNWSTAALNPWIVKRFTFLFFLAVSSLSLNAQVKGEKTSLELGSVTVWLGMSKQEVLRRCTVADYMVVTKTGDNHVTIVDGKDLTEDSRIFNVILKNDRVTFASRNWYSSKAEPFEAVLGALEQLGESRSGCSVFHDQDKSPGSGVIASVALDRVSITCEFRTIRIESGSMNGKPIADEYEQIDSGER